MSDVEVSADAPGRVNLMGEHTDYHEGFVLPTVLPQRTTARIRGLDGRIVRVFTAMAPDRPLEYQLGEESPGRGWIDYVQGLTVALAALRIPLTGFELRLESTVPIGAGVSSSAALEIAVLRGLRSLFGLKLDDVELAQAAHAAETRFVGVPVGIMDQMASSLGSDRDALFLDTRTLAYEPIPIPRSLGLIVINSGVAHAHAGGEYGVRRSESFAAAAFLGVPFLRDLGIDRLGDLATLPHVLQRRARHVISENQRVLDAVTALRTADLATLGRIFDASHTSLRDDYEVTVPHVDTLAALGRSHPHVYGARLTGGGFGGAVVMIADAGCTETAAVDISRKYEDMTGQPSRVLMPASDL